MTNQELISAIDKIQKSLPESAKCTPIHREIFFIQTIQFVRTYIGVETEFYARLKVYQGDTGSNNVGERWYTATCVLEAIKEYFTNDLEVWKTTSYKIKNDIVSDLLQQANQLLKKKEFHPAAAAILIGATLEEFLRILMDKHSLTFPENSTLSVYAAELTRANVLTKQDNKDITTWAGLRNDATHGHFEEVNDPKRVKLALEGVNLFMRKHSV